MDTVLLALLAGSAFVLAKASDAWSPGALILRSAGEMFLLVLVSFVLRIKSQSRKQAMGSLALVLCAAIVYPFLAELAVRFFDWEGEPLEMLMLTSLMLATLALAMFSYLPRIGGTVVLMSSFLVLFATTITTDRSPKLLAGVFGALGLWWLMGTYWDRLATSFVASKVEQRIPIRISVLGVSSVLLLMTAMLFGARNRSIVALSGFMPTSGGTQSTDPYARSGVGDGDAVVAATEEANSFGPTDSDIFLDSEMPSLYDLFNDMYGEPPSKKKKVERSIALAGSDVKESEQRVSKSESAGREFSAARRRRKRKRKPLEDRTSPAMLYVVGNAPLHLALERYDTFDGRVWTYSGKPDRVEPPRMSPVDGNPWVFLMRVGASPIHQSVQPYAVKVINLKTNRIPSPPQLTAAYIDKVDQPDFYGWSEDGVLEMPVRDHIPQLTIIHLRSQGINLESLREATRPAPSDADSSPTSRVAHRWAHGVPPGWRQVEAVVDRLRTDFVCDPEAVASADCLDVVDHFLQAKRGPSYLFATTAAVLLRELGHETRLVTGFYARKDRYDRRAGQTTVLAEDAHVWVEVKSDTGAWVAVEPTPGYQPPREQLSWRQRLSLASSALKLWVVGNAGWLLLGVFTAIALWWSRLIWLDQLLEAACRVVGSGSPRRQVLWTVRLLEWRAWLGGHARPPSATLSAWYGELALTLTKEHSGHLLNAMLLVERYLYAPPHGGAELRAVDVDTVCQAVRRKIRVPCFQRFGSRRSHPSSHSSSRESADSCHPITATE